MAGKNAFIGFMSLVNLPISQVKKVTMALLLIWAKITKLCHHAFWVDRFLFWSSKFLNSLEGPGYL